MADRIPTRRDVLRAVGVSALGLGLTACGRGFGGGSKDTSGGGTVQLNMVWWGDATRAKKTQAALDIFHQDNPTIIVKTEYQDSGPYKDKLATRFAAGDAPDLLAMRTDSLREYADRRSLLDLNQHTDQLNLSDLPANVRAIGTVGEHVYGVPSGLNSIGFVVNKTITEKYGVSIPDGNTWGWKDLAAFAKEVSAKSGRKVYGTGFDAGTLANIIVFTRQRGEDFFTADGRLGVSEATVTAWFDMIEKMRAEGGFPPAGFFDNIGSSAAESPLAKGTLACQIIPANNFLSYNKDAGGNLALLRMPGETTERRRGQAIDTPHLWSISAKSKHPEETLKLLDFLVNDARASKATGTTRGVPVNPKVTKEIESTLAPDDQVATSYLTKLQAEDLLPSSVNPTGSSAVAASLKTISTEVEFRRQTPAAGAKAFIAAGQKVLTR